MNDQPTTTANPLLEDWPGAFGVPPFDRIAPEHFMPAFDRAFAEHDAEIAAIAERCAPSRRSQNTIEALERSGRPLDACRQRLRRARGRPHQRRAAGDRARDFAAPRPPLERHPAERAAVPPHRRALRSSRDQLGLNAEQARVLERYYLMFKRAGAALDAAARKRLAEITERLATLGTTFSQNVLADEQAYTLVLESEDDRAGPARFRAGRPRARRRASAAWPASTSSRSSRSSVEPFLQFSARRDLREKVFRAWIARGDGGGKTDNKAIIAEMLALRAERARLLGYESFAHYRLDDAMAKTPQAVRDLLERVWAPARARALADRDAMQALVQEEGGNFTLAPWDWRYYAEKLRKRRCDIDEATIKPYFQLDHIIEAAFYTAYRLFGLSFERRTDVAGWHPDVQAWEVRGADGSHRGLFFGDYFARSSKRSGAWMTTLRDQEKLAGDVRPLIVNVMNFSKAGGDAADAAQLRRRAHAVPRIRPRAARASLRRHLSDGVGHQRAHRLGGAALAALRALARAAGNPAAASRCITAPAQPMPDELMQRLLAARTFNQGFATVEYVASRAGRSRLPSAGRAPRTSTSTPSRRRRWRASACRPRSSCATGRRISRTCSPAAATPRPITATCGRRCSTPMRSRPSRRPATSSIPATAKACTITSMRPAARAIRRTLYKAFRGRLPTPEALLRRRGLAAVPS